MVTTPSSIATGIIDFCKELCGSEPEFILPSPAPWADASYCHENVQRQVFEFGGSVQHGWLIWEASIDAKPAYYDAEFHAVWRNTAGILVDITPTRDGEIEVLFAPDDERKYEGIRLPNKQHKILTNDPEIQEFLQMIQNETV